jgi:hypothetical protein
MADNNPTHNNDGGSGGNDPAAKNHDIVAAINSLQSKSETTPEHNRQILLWTKRTAIGVVVYTGLTVFIAGAAFWSAWDAQRAVSLTAKNFIIDQRPYLWLSDNGRPVVYSNPDGQHAQISWTWFYTNYGKTPSNNMEFDSFIRLGEANDFKPAYKGENGVVGRSVGAPTTPNKSDHATVVSEPIPKEKVTEYLDADRSVSISVVISYKGASNDAFETRFCLGKLKSGDIAYLRSSKNCENSIK